MISLLIRALEGLIGRVLSYSRPSYRTGVAVEPFGGDMHLLDLDGTRSLNHKPHYASLLSRDDSCHNPY